LLLEKTDMAKTFNTADALAVAAKAAVAAAARFKPTVLAPLSAPAALVMQDVPVPAAPTAVEAPPQPVAAATPAPPTPKAKAQRGKPAKQPAVQAEGAKVQFNIVLSPQARQKIKRAAFALGTTERELVEAFIEQLPDVAVPEPEVPSSLRWLKR
jgi:hypothetical protein